MEAVDAFDAALAVDDGAEREGAIDGRSAGLRAAVCDGYKLGALSGDVAWDEVGAIASWTEVILLLESTEEGGDGKRGNRSAALLSQACRVFPLDNAQARAQEVEVGADLQRIRARSKAMLLAAGLVIPGLDSARGGGAGQGQGRAPITPGGGALTAVDGASPALPAAGSRGVPVAGAMGVDLQF